MKSTGVSRREFLSRVSTIPVAMAAPSFLRANSGGPARMDKLNIALVGVGGIGSIAVEASQHENIIAFCDVDDSRIEGLAKNKPEIKAIIDGFPDAAWFKDYRKMFDRISDKIDAVIVSTPDHSHYSIARSAINLGKHVYVQKPLAHSIWEVRDLLAAARQHGVVTQMGNQGHANDGTRKVREWVQAGIIGEVREVHSWTNRPIWPQGLNAPDHSQSQPEIPSSLDWNLWLNTAQERAYDPAYVPFKWRGWWDFGTGAFGDMACHIMDAAYWALDLGFPSEISAVSTPVTRDSAPTSSIVTFNFPARGSMPPVAYSWYEGGLLPAYPPTLDQSFQRGDNGTFIMGSEGIIHTDTYARSVHIVPYERFQELRSSLPDPSIPRVANGPFQEFFDAIRGGPQPGSHFGYSAPFTEMVLLGVLAQRLERTIPYDAEAMKIPGHPEADPWIRGFHRPGWILS